MPILRNITRRVFTPKHVTVTLGHAQTIIDGMDTATLYEQQPHLRTVVDFIARNIAQLPINCYKLEADDRRMRQTAGLVEQVFARPNPDMTGYELIFSTVASLKLYDTAIWIYGPDAESDTGWVIYPIPPDWVVDYGGGNAFHADTIRFVNNYLSGEPVDVSADNFLIFSGYNPTSPRDGMSPVAALKQTLTEQISAQAYRRQIWERGGRIPAYISRPAGQSWTDAAFSRFATDFRKNWAGNHGEKAGGVPILEDGMEIKSAEFNAREAQWIEGAELSLKTCCSVYHINPALIGGNEGQTYASVKDNARSLYTDTLGPDLKMLQDRINAFLLPAIGADPAEYIEFDVYPKTRGSFEEETSAMQTSVGGPWRTRNEARAMQGLPPIDGGDEIITPLNVLIGGQASPTDSGSTSSAYFQLGKSGSCECCKSDPPAERKAKGDPEESEIEPYRAALSKFFKRQAKSVLPAIGAAEKAEVPTWWDSDRWNRELADDLMDAVMSGSTAAAKRAAGQLGLDPEAFDSDRTVNYLRAVVETRAGWINDTTLKALLASIAGDYSDDAEKSDPAGVFDEAETTRADQSATTLATTVAAWSAIEAARQLAGDSATKTWETRSGDPRSSHRRMNGETVRIGQRFSNGAYWPGDSKHLPVEEVANCRCTVTLTLPEGN